MTDPQATDETRIDRWLCAVRLVEDSSAGDPPVRGRPRRREWIAGEAVDEGSRGRSGRGLHRGSRERIVEVVRPIESRVGALVAATCYVDHSPPVVQEAGPKIMLIRGEGRPSKRLRRELERLRRAGAG